MLGQDRFGLALALMERARWVQDRLDTAAQLGVDQHEETITQSVLLDLKLGLPQLSISVYTKRQENRTSGADWMWLWQGDQRWFGHLVQAKRLTRLASGLRGYGIGYRPRSGDGSIAPTQIETLLAASRRHRMPAVFALYNPSVTEPRAGYCPLHQSGAAEEGITMLSADVAGQLLKTPVRPKARTVSLRPYVSLARVAVHARPWSCLATCQAANCSTWPSLKNLSWRDIGFPEPADREDLAFGAAVAVHFAKVSLAGREPSQRELLDDDLIDVRAGVREELPQWASRMAEANEQNGAGEMPEDIHGVVIVRPAN